MSGVVRLERGSDLGTPGGRELLQETLELVSQRLRTMGEELEKVRESDKIVAPVPIEEFPTALGITPSQVGGAPAGSILFTTVDTQPPGYLTCSGSGGTPDLQGRVPVGSGIGSGLTSRAVGDSFGAETVAADLQAHTHTMGNHTHSTPAHSHNMAHTHDTTNPTSHVHNTTFYSPGAGSTSGPSLTASGGAPTSAVNTSGPSSNTTSQPSTSVTATDGSGTSGTPSTNNTDSSGGGGGHNNMQPSRVLKALYKSAPGDLDLSRVAPVLFGRVPAVFSVEGPSEITNASCADAFEVVTAGLAPEKITELLMTVGIAGGQSSCTLRGSVYIPYNFRKWKTAAVRLKTKLVMAGCAPASQAVVTLKARKPTSTSAYLVGTSTRTLTVDGGGAIADAGWVDMTLKTTDLGDDWQPGYFLAFEVTWSFPKTFTSCSVKVGRLQINW